MGKTFAVEGSLHADTSPGGAGQPGKLKASGESPVATVEVAIPDLSHTQLIPRGQNTAEETNGVAPNGCGAPKPAEQ